MSSEQVFAAKPNIIAKDTARHPFERFITQEPQTHGVYEGGPMTIDGVYISPAVSEPGVEADNLPRLVDVRLTPGAILGSGDSQNGVIFGVLETKVHEDSFHTQVAIKPFQPDEYDTEKAERAAYEHDRLVDAAEMGFDTFRPLALMKDGETTYLLTEFRPDIMTMDNVDWTISPNDPRYKEELLPALHFIAGHMGETHGKGLFNGDPQPKNFAKSDTGRPVVMDLEYATVASNPSEHAAWLSGGWEVRDSRAYQDVKQFWFTLTRGIGSDNPNVFLAEEDYETSMREFESNFLNPYLESLQKNTPNEVLEQIDIHALRTGIYEYTARMA